MRIYFSLLILFLSNYGYAQTRISGKVVDDQTNAPISGISVYLNNTTCGTATNKDGEFLISCPILGKAELVFSHVNYTKQIKIIAAGDGQNLVVSLKARDNNLNEVTIKLANKKKPSKADKAKWYKLFSVNLIGVYGHGSSICKITNPEVLDYYFDDDTKQLTVKANKPLEIENLNLGYKIKLDLENFEFNLVSNEVAFKYSCLYEDLRRNKFRNTEIINTRNLAYKGSSMHLMRSLYLNRLVEAGFILYQYKADKNTEKTRVKEIILKRMAEAYANGDKPDVSLPYLFSKDTAAYYATVMKQLDVKKFDAVEVGALKLTEKDKSSRTVNFNFTDTLLVNYKKYIVDPKTRVPVHTLGQTVYRRVELSEEDSKPPLATFMYFFAPGGVNIERNGYYPEFSLFMYGDMAERRIANALPFDFEPKEDDH